MPPFVSSYVMRIDNRGRVSVPAAFRTILAQQDLRGVYCIPSFTNPALAAFGETLLSRFQGRLANHDPIFSEQYDDEAQVVLAATQFLPFDEQGRIHLPLDLIGHAKLGEQAVFVGLNEKMEIWDPVTFEPVRAARLLRARSLRGKV